MNAVTFGAALAAFAPAPDSGVRAQGAVFSSTPPSSPSQSNLPRSDSQITTPAGAPGQQSELEEAKIQRDVALGRLAAPPTIDGVIGEDEWKTAARVELRFQVQPGDNGEPSERTEVLLASDREHLYLLFRCYDSDPRAIRAPVSRRDSVYNDDYVAAYLDTYDDRRRAYVFYFNPRGIQADAVITGGTLQTTGGEVEDVTWDGILTSRGGVTAEGYVVEAAIPFRTLRFRAGEGRRWGLHLQRWIARKAERIYWQPISRDRSELLAQMGTMSNLGDIYAGRTLDLIPTITGSINGERGALPLSPTRLPTGARLSNVNRLDPGLTAVYTITPNLTLSGAINPDFSQVEADVPQVNVNQRFPLFFPERRPFFLEGIEVFRSPGALTFVNTRQIVDPDWGVKLTGKVGKNTVGFLSASDRAPGLRVPPTSADFGRNAQFQIFRYQRDVLRDSRVGAFLLDRRFGDQRNTVAAIDGQIRFRNVNTVGFQAARSRTTGLMTASASDGPRAGSAIYVWYEHRGRNLRVFANDLRVTPDYRAQTGFVRRTGYHANSANVGYEWQARENSWWVSFRPFVVPKYARTVEGLTDESYVDPGFDLKLARGMSFYVYRSYRRDAFLGREYDYARNIAFYTINAFRRVDFDGSVQWGEGVNFDRRAPQIGRAWESQTTVNFRPTNTLALQLLHVKSNLRARDTGARLFNQDIFRTTVRYQLTRFQNVRFIGDYDTARRQTGLSLLYAYTPRPNTALFIGYNDLLFNGVDPLDNTRVAGFVRQRRTLFTKLSYNFRF